MRNPFKRQRHACPPPLLFQDQKLTIVVGKGVLADDLEADRLTFGIEPTTVRGPDGRWRAHFGLRHPDGSLYWIQGDSAEFSLSFIPTERTP